MRGGDQGKGKPGILNRFYPLVSIQILRIENLVIGHRVNPVLLLIVSFPVKYMQIVMEYCTKFSFLPCQLTFVGNRYRVLLHRNKNNVRVISLSYRHTQNLRFSLFLVNKRTLQTVGKQF